MFANQNSSPSSCLEQSISPLPSPSNVNVASSPYTTPRQNYPDQGPVAILWDIENCSVPSDVNPEDVAGNIRMALRVHPFIQGAVTSFSAYGDFSAFPRKLREGCQRTGVKLVDVPNGRKDAADKAILVDMFLFALDNPPPSSIMLISGDVDFSAALHILGQRGYTVILVIPSGNSVSSALCNAGRYVWDWPSVARAEGFRPPVKPLMAPQNGANDSPSFCIGCRMGGNACGHDEEVSVYRGLGQSHYNSQTGEASNKKPRTDEGPVGNQLQVQTQPQEQPLFPGCKNPVHPDKGSNGANIVCCACKQPGHKSNLCALGINSQALFQTQPAENHCNLHSGEASNKKLRTDEGPAENEVQVQTQPREQLLCTLCKKPCHPGKRCNGADVVCYVCKQPGHKANVCALGKNSQTPFQTQPSERPLCYKCRKHYHPGKGCDGADMACFVCKQPGHKSFDCPQKVKADGTTVASAPKAPKAAIRLTGTQKQAGTAAKKSKGPMTRSQKQAVTTPKSPKAPTGKLKCAVTFPKVPKAPVAGAETAPEAPKEATDIAETAPETPTYVTKTALEEPKIPTASARTAPEAPIAPTVGAEMARELPNAPTASGEMAPHAPTAPTATTASAGPAPIAEEEEGATYIEECEV